MSGNGSEKIAQTLELCEQYEPYMDVAEYRKVLEGAGRFLAGTQTDRLLICGGQNVNLPGLMALWFGFQNSGLPEYACFHFTVRFTYGAEKSLSVTTDGEQERAIPFGTPLPSGIAGAHVCLPQESLKGKCVVLAMLDDQTVREQFFREATESTRCVLYVSGMNSVLSYDRTFCELVLSQQDDASKVCVLIDNRSRSTVPELVAGVLGGILQIGTDRLECCESVGDPEEDRETLNRLFLKASAVDPAEKAGLAADQTLRNLQKDGGEALERARESLAAAERQAARYRVQVERFHADVNIASFRTGFLFDESVSEILNKDIGKFFLAFQKQLLAELDSMPTNQEVIAYYSYYFTDTIQNFLDNEINAQVRPHLEKNIEQLRSYIIRGYQTSFETEALPEALRVLLYEGGGGDLIGFVDPASNYIDQAIYVPLGDILYFVLLSIPGHELLEFVMEASGFFGFLEGLLNKMINTVMPRGAFDKLLYKKTVEMLDKSVSTLQNKINESVFPIIQDEVKTVIGDFLTAVDRVVDEKTAEYQKNISDRNTTVSRQESLLEQCGNLLRQTETA
jgi:hypothetical protein